MWWTCSTRWTAITVILCKHTKIRLVRQVTVPSPPCRMTEGAICLLCPSHGYRGTVTCMYFELDSHCNLPVKFVSFTPGGWFFSFTRRESCISNNFLSYRFRVTSLGEAFRLFRILSRYSEENRGAMIQGFFRQDTSIQVPGTRGMPCSDKKCIALSLIRRIDYAQYIFTYLNRGMPK